MEAPGDPSQTRCRIHQGRPDSAKWATWANAAKNILSLSVSWDISLRAQGGGPLSLLHTLCAPRPSSFLGEPLTHSLLDLRPLLFSSEPPFPPFFLQRGAPAPTPCSPNAPHQHGFLSGCSSGVCISRVVLQGIGPQVLTDDLAGQTGKSAPDRAQTLSAHWGFPQCHCGPWPEGPYLSYPTRPRAVVVRQPVEEVQAAAIMPATAAPTFIIPVPTDWSGMTLPIPWKRRGGTSGSHCRGARALTLVPTLPPS